MFGCMSGHHCRYRAVSAHTSIPNFADIKRCGPPQTTTIMKYYHANNHGIRRNESLLNIKEDRGKDGNYEHIYGACLLFILYLMHTVNGCILHNSTGLSILL